MAFSVFEEGIKPVPLFYVALVITLSGVVIYETAPSPVVDSLDESLEEIQLTEHHSTRDKDRDKQNRNVIS